MGEYYLKCEPTNTKENMKDVLKFVNNPIFNSSVFSKDTLNSYFKIILFVIMISSGAYIGFNRENIQIALNYIFKTNTSNNESSKNTTNRPSIVGPALSLVVFMISFLFFILLITDVIN